MGTGWLSTVSKVGWVGKLGKGIFIWDVGGNAVMVGKGGIGIAQNGLNLQNGVQVFGGLFGLGGNVAGRWGRNLPLARSTDNAAEALPAPKTVPRTITKIGDLTAQEKQALGRIWTGGPRSALPLETREALAAHYRRVGMSPANPPGSAQRAFQEARARYLLGQGPNPGRNVHEFSQRTGIPIYRRGGGQ